MARCLWMELARAIVNLIADEETRVRYDTLAEARTGGQLTPAGLEKLGSFVRINTQLGEFR